jgi:transposase
MARTIGLTERERVELTKRTRGGTKASEGRRARCLLLADQGWTVEKVAEAVGCGTATVKRVKARYRMEGWLGAITAKHGGGMPHRLGPLEARRLIALACSEPRGGTRWTIRALSAATDISRMTVQRTLQRDGIKPWREKNVVRRRTR